MAEQRLQELERDLSALLANERALMTSPSPQGLCDQILQQAIEATGADAGSVFLKEPSGRLIVASAAGERAEAVRQYALPAGRGVAGAVAETGAPVVSDAANDPRHDRATAMRLEYPVEGILAVPITHRGPGGEAPGNRDGNVVGVIEVLTRQGSGKKFDDADVRLLEIMAGQAARAIEAARLLDQRMRAERLEALGMVIRGVVHDVRNPLTFINGYAEMVADQADAKEREKARDAIFRNVEDINEMLRELADFVSGDDTVHKNPADLVSLVKEIAAHFSPRAEKLKVGIKVRPRKKRMDVWIDAPKLRRSIANLMKNALEATPAGGRIVLGVARGKKDVWIWVRDSGRGIPPEIMARLFEPFVTHGKKGGTGLGLSICKRFAEQHGGEVECRTKAGKGSRFAIRIPAE